MDKVVTLAHGAGGKQTAELIDRVFKAHFSNPEFTADDAAVLQFASEKLAFTTDGFIVSPPEFPGGNIGKLSICGTVNDLSCMGAQPLYLSCAFVIEEGFPMEKLEAYAAAMEKTAAEAGVRIVAGDTKVAGKGQVDNLFITTTGIGRIMDGVGTSGANARPGDAVIVTGDVGRHAQERSYAGSAHAAPALQLFGTASHRSASHQHHRQRLGYGRGQRTGPDDSSGRLHAA